MCVGDWICEGSHTTISCPTKLNSKRREWSEYFGDGSYFPLEKAVPWDCKGGNGIPRSLSRSLDIDLLPTRTAQLGQQLLSGISTRRPVSPLRGLSNLVMPCWENADKSLTKLTINSTIKYYVLKCITNINLFSWIVKAIKLSPSLTWEVFLHSIVSLYLFACFAWTSPLWDSTVLTNYWVITNVVHIVKQNCTVVTWVLTK